VVCPAALRLNWQREFAKWDAHGRLIAVATDVVPSTNVVVTNYDRLAKLHPGLKAVEWDLIILDEAHYLKNADAKRTKLVFGKDGLRGKRWVSLSGTPLMNRPAELWTHCKAYDPNGLGRSWREYHVRYCNGHINYMGHWDISGASHLDELNRLLRERFMIRREKTEVLKELPPKRRQLIAVDPRSDTERALVNREREILNTLEAEYGDVVKALSEPGALPAISELSRIRHETALLKTSYVVEH
ncbi:MAG: SNF2-related protein, partial [Anaerolineae bacterium]|nr:SNF2-related protein [Thermoflexales bacterium]MDW8409033.1 SNF2-related protein [Anaerolineae bacterium]